MNRVPHIVFLGFALVVAARAEHRIKQVAEFESGMSGLGRVVLGDMDHDSLAEMSFYHTAPGQRLYLWQTWRCTPHNTYVLAKSDSCEGTPDPPEGINKGTFHPTDIGDVDEDGLMDILGVNAELFYSSLSCGAPMYDSVRLYVCLYESPDAASLPDTLVWTYHYGSNVTLSPLSWFPGDMDKDGSDEIVFAFGCVGYIFESRGNNRNDLVWTSPYLHSGYDYAFGDFDQDSATEFVFADVGSDYVYVYECTGNDEYTWTDSISHLHPNGADIFSGNDLDMDGKPEFFIVYLRIEPLQYFVYMYEATGNNTYEGVFVDSGGLTATAQARHSLCSDIDGDGQEELLVSFNDFIRVYEATGNNQFECVFHWWNRAPGHHESHIQSHDMNRNGYNDIVISGNSHTWILEMEAVKLLYPNGGQNLIPGITHLIQWETYDPPRCDSVSLFLRRDTTWQLDTIATGLAPNDTGFPWVIPPGPVDSCWVVAVAYGPGWQYDESDAPFRIRPGGVAEAGSGKSRYRLQTPTVVGHVLWMPRDMTDFGSGESNRVPRPALLDVCGRQVMSLQPGPNDIRHLAPGVYFVREEGPRIPGSKGSGVRKIVVQH